MLESTLQQNATNHFVLISCFGNWKVRDKCI